MKSCKIFHTINTTYLPKFDLKKKKKKKKEQLFKLFLKLKKTLNYCYTCS